MFNNINIYQQRADFLRIVDEIRNGLGYALRNNEPDHGDELAMEMQYGEFHFALVHSLSNAPDRILIECCFGLLPEARAEKIMFNLLNMNCMLSEIDGSAFSLDPETNEVIYTLAVDIFGQSGKNMLSKMTEIVWHGRRWLETRFISEQRSSGAAVDPVALA